MVTNKIKDKPMLLTSHRLGMIKIANKFKAIPAAELKPEQKRFLKDFANDEKGIMTIRDAQDKKADDREAAEAKAKQDAINADIQRIMDKRAEKKPAAKVTKNAKAKTEHK